MSTWRLHHKLSSWINRYLEATHATWAALQNILKVSWNLLLVSDSFQSSPMRHWIEYHIPPASLRLKPCSFETSTLGNCTHMEKNSMGIVLFPTNSCFCLNFDMTLEGVCVCTVFLGMIIKRIMWHFKNVASVVEYIPHMFVKSIFNTSIKYFAWICGEATYLGFKLENLHCLKDSGGWLYYSL